MMLGITKALSRETAFRSFSTDAANTPSFHTQVTVIGGGVVGLAITRALAMAGTEVLLLEQANAICTETSARNSEVIHAGIYYPKETHKANFCVQGKQMIYEYCAERGIEHQKCGKLIVATNKTQLEKDLPALYKKAHLNGVEDVHMASQEDVQVMEPNVRCLGALFSPSSGVLDSHSFYVNLLTDCEDAGATVALNTKVIDADVFNGRLCLNADGTWISSDYVINSAGLWAGEVARKIHKQDPKWQPPEHFFAKGTYFRFQGKSSFRHLIYPVPEPGGLGVHATIDWGGVGIKFGPDVEWLKPGTGPDEISYNPDPRRGDKFYGEIRKYWPDLPSGSLGVDYVGVRPKLSHPTTSLSTESGTTSGGVKFEDFRIVGPKTHGIPGLIHLFGIESPGLTSSMAIANYIKEILPT